MFITWSSPYIRYSKMCWTGCTTLSSQSWCRFKWSFVVSAHRVDSEILEHLCIYDACLCLSVCVCLCVCVRACALACVCVCFCLWLSVPVSVCPSVCLCLCSCVCACVPACVCEYYMLTSLMTVYRACLVARLNHIRYGQVKNSAVQVQKHDRDIQEVCLDAFTSTMMVRTNSSPRHKSCNNNNNKPLLSNANNTKKSGHVVTIGNIPWMNIL